MISRGCCLPKSILTFACYCCGVLAVAMWKPWTAASKCQLFTNKQTKKSVFNTANAINESKYFWKNPGVENKYSFSNNALRHNYGMFLVSLHVSVYSNLYFFTTFQTTCVAKYSCFKNIHAKDIKRLYHTVLEIWDSVISQWLNNSLICKQNCGLLRGSSFSNAGSLLVLVLYCSKLNSLKVQIW